MVRAQASQVQAQAQLAAAAAAAGGGGISIDTTTRYVFVLSLALCLTAHFKLAWDWLVCVVLAMLLTLLSVLVRMVYDSEMECRRLEARRKNLMQEAARKRVSLARNAAEKNKKHHQETGKEKEKEKEKVLNGKRNGKNKGMAGVDAADAVGVGVRQSAATDVGSHGDDHRPKTTVQFSAGEEKREEAQPAVVHGEKKKRTKKPRTWECAACGTAVDDPDEQRCEWRRCGRFTCDVCAGTCEQCESRICPECQRLCARMACRTVLCLDPACHVDGLCFRCNERSKGPPDEGIRRRATPRQPQGM